jgi:hypothetical protein
MEVVVSCVIRSSGVKELVTGRILSNHALAETCTPHKKSLTKLITLSLLPQHTASR